MTSATESSQSNASVEQRVAQLRERAGNDPHQAEQEAWGWFETLKQRASSDQKAADDELNELFRTGVPATGLTVPPRASWS